MGERGVRGGPFEGLGADRGLARVQRMPAERQVVTPQLTCSGRASTSKGCRLPRRPRLAAPLVNAVWEPIPALNTRCRRCRGRRGGGPARGAFEAAQSACG